MARGKTRSRLTRSERLEEAFRLFRKGYSNADVARRLGVHADTITSYRKKYEAKIAVQAENNPDLLTKVLENTLRVIEETDVIRQEVWRTLEPKKTKERVECEECGHENIFTTITEPSGQTKSALLNTLLKAQEQRMKSFGLTGIKQEVFVLFQQVDQVQRALLEFMARQLCSEDREKLAQFIEARFPNYAQSPALPAVLNDDEVAEGEVA